MVKKISLQNYGKLLLFLTDLMLTGSKFQSVDIATIKHYMVNLSVVR